MSTVTVAITDPPKSRFRELERFVGQRLYHKGTDSGWYVDLQSREQADLLIANLKANQYQAHILGEPA